jgi:integrase
MLSFSVPSDLVGGTLSPRFSACLFTACLYTTLGMVSPHVVSEIVGHSDVSITLGVYGHVLRDMHEDAMQKMEGLFGGG